MSGLHLLLFDIIPDSEMFRPGDDGHISVPVSSLETRYFPQHTNCSKQCWHLRTPIDVKYPQGVPRSRQIPGYSPECTNHKNELICPARSWYLWIFPTSPSWCSYSKSIRIHSWHKCDNRAIALQALVSQDGRIPHEFQLLHSRILAMVKARVTSLRTRDYTSCAAPCATLSYRHMYSFCDGWMLPLTACCTFTIFVLLLVLLVLLFLSERDQHTNQVALVYKYTKPNRFTLTPSLIRAW